MKVFHYNYNTNAGDVITPRLLTFFKPQIKFETAQWNTKGKLTAVGSILECLENDDVVWGSGFIKRGSSKDATNVKILATRGPLSKDRLLNNSTPCVYGDPGLLVSLMFNPSTEKKYGLGIIPHFYDYDIAKKLYPRHLIIDILRPIEQIVEQITSCCEIASSSLHGIVFAEAFGIPARWISISNNLVGGDFKFHDYLLGTDREIQYCGRFPPIPSLPSVQNRLLKALDILDTLVP